MLREVHRSIHGTGPFLLVLFEVTGCFELFVAEVTLNFQF